MERLSLESEHDEDGVQMERLTVSRTIPWPERKIIRVSTPYLPNPNYPDKYFNNLNIGRRLPIPFTHYKLYWSQGWKPPIKKRNKRLTKKLRGW